MRQIFLVLVVLGVVAAGQASDWRQDWSVIQDSLSRVHPRRRASWLKERGIADPYYTTFQKPESAGLRCIGRWSYGPSYDVDGRVTPSETLVALARGSGVSLLRFSRQDSLTIELLSDINAGGIMKRVAVRDSLLYVGSTAGLEIWDIADERNPVQLSWLHTALNDFVLRDSFAYVIADDSFKVYNISNSQNPSLCGACRDSGEVVAVTNNAAFLGDRWGLYVVDVSNPDAPHRIGSWGSAIEQVAARGRLCYVTTFNPNQPGEIVFRVLDVTVPASPVQIGSLRAAGGSDVHLVDTLAYCSGENDFNRLTIVSVADSTRPRLVGSAGTPGWSMGIWASGLSHSAFVAGHWEGLQVFDTRNTSMPVRDTFLLGTDQAVDIYLDRDRAYVANYMAGLKILDVSNPAIPSLLGMCDTAGQPPAMRSVVARDSFAFVGWTRPRFRTLDVTDPVRPELVGTCEITNPPEDMLLRDSLVYVAQAARFQIVNVARPRQPKLVGSCEIPNTGVDLNLYDTLAYVSAWPSPIVNVSNPSAPYVVGTLPLCAGGIVVLDTFALAPDGGDSLWVFSVRDPASPRRLNCVPLTGIPQYTRDIELVGSRAYTAGSYVHMLDVSSPVQPRELAHWRPPYVARRIVWEAPYFYVACWDAGICILETTQVGIHEAVEQPPTTVPLLFPNPTPGKAAVRVLQALDGITVYDALGRVVGRFRPRNSRFSIELTGLRSGLYFVELRYDSGKVIEKLVKR